MSHTDAFEAICDDAKTRIQEISLEDYLARADQLVLIDVREDREFDAGSMPGAIHVGKGVLERDVLQHVRADQPVVLFCGGGYRSALAADNLQKMGFTQVWSLAGGVKAWWRHTGR